MKKMLSFFLLVLIPLIFLKTSVSAFDMRGGEHIVIGEQEVIDGTLFVGGTNVEINGHIQGDVICAGQKVTVNAVVDGDVICAGQMININGDVLGNVRIAGQTLNINGTVERNVTAAGQDITLGTESTIGSDVMFVGQGATVNGIVGRDIGGATQNLIINGQINRSVTAQAEMVNVGPTAIIKGNFLYTSGKQANIDPKAIISGTTKFTQEEKMEKANKQEKKPIPWVQKWFSMGRIVSIFFYTILALVLMTLFPTLGQRIIHVMEVHPMRSTGIGIISIIVVPVLIISFVLTIIGIPVSLILAAGYVVILYVGRMCVGYVIGKRILRQGMPKGTISRIWSAVIGIPLVLILFGMPYIGWVISFILTMWGLGGILLSFAQKKK